jgi:DNA-binding response OmpR family regulator
MPHAPSNSLPWSIRQFRLLYIGDDLPLTSSIRQFFPTPKYHVVTCPARGCAEMFIKSDIQYDLFIFDHEMRDRAAFDLARLIRSLPHRERSAVVVVGTESEDTLGDFTKSAGGNAYLRKVDGFSEIHKAISRYLAEAISSSIGTPSGTASRPDTGS